MYKGKTLIKPQRVLDFKMWFPVYLTVSVSSEKLQFQFNLIKINEEFLSI